MTGKSIAQKVASNGIDVVVLEVSEERAAKAREELAANLDEELRKWGITASEKKVILSRVGFVHDPAARRRAPTSSSRPCRRISRPRSA